MKRAGSGNAKIHSSNWTLWRSWLPWMLLWIGVAAATAIGCGWEGTEHSVRFNSYENEREMGRLPPLPTLANGSNELRASWGMEGDGSEDEYTRARTQTKEADDLWDSAGATEQNGDLRSAQQQLRRYLELTAIARSLWFEPKDRQLRRNSAIDRIDALNSLVRGSSETRVRAYLKARRSYDAEKSDATEIQQALDQAGEDPKLKDNVAYLKAAQLYKQHDYAEAAKAFGGLARKYPRSEKREGAIFMSAVALMKTSNLFSSADAAQSSDDDLADGAELRAVDQAWREAVTVFRKLKTENPRGRFSNDARGWLAYLLLHGHDRVGALVEYYRLLSDKRDENARIEAAFSLQLVRKRATNEEMARVEKILESEPEAALAYAYHNIYNYAIDPGPSYPPYDDEVIRDSSGNINYDAQQARYKEREKHWQKERVTTGRQEMLRVLDFSRRLLKRYPNVVSGSFALRAAQASLELGDNASAAQFARRALQNGVGGDERAQALWTSGVAEFRLSNHEVARRHFAGLLAEYPSGHLVEGARRLLAMIAEDSGDFDTALEQYLALDYTLDVAYFVDVLLTPEQLASFIKRHAGSAKHNELLYALGVRYLRANRWAEARETLAQVKTANPSSYDIYSTDIDCYQSGVACNDPKRGDLDFENNPIITPILIMRDIQTANDLEALEQTAERALDDEAKAEALYQFASYQYGASKLLFYNPVAWAGARYWSLSELAGGAKYRAFNESQQLWEYMQQHETFSRALKIYLDVAQQYPRTRAGRDALYTAAVCHERLSNYSPYWRNVYENGLHAGQRMVTYADVKARYPNYQLPRGTYDWQPSTRTVNGGPGWSAPPKPTPPKPKPTRLARTKKVFPQLLGNIERFWNETGRKWTLVTILFSAILLVAGISAWTRRMLRGQIARLKLNEDYEDTYPWMMLFQVEPVEVRPREQAKLFLQSLRERAWQLALDKEGRQVLAANVFAHSLTLWLFIVLLQTLFMT